MPKQAIIIRDDLKMGKGKLCSQSCHASIASFLKSSKVDRGKWIKEGMKKVVLKISGEKELINLYESAKKDKLPCELIIDAGLTQIKPGTLTALGIGPSDDKKIDKITGKLKLL
jgi:PTH2 family peptidyl-tRNA hydrolase